jgi:hypothetical protein
MLIVSYYYVELTMVVLVIKCTNTWLGILYSNSVEQKDCNNTIILNACDRNGSIVA